MGCLHLITQAYFQSGNTELRGASRLAEHKQMQKHAVTNLANDQVLKTKYCINLAIPVAFPAVCENKVC
jgi:hypothetical protein